MSETITITVGREKRELRVSEIEYLTGAENYSFIHVVGHKTPFLISRTLKVMESRLPMFQRIHKQTLINPARMSGYSMKGNQTFVRFSNDRAFPVSRRRAETFDFVSCKL